MYLIPFSLEIGGFESFKYCLYYIIALHNDQTQRIFRILVAECRELNLTHAEVMSHFFQLISHYSEIIVFRVELVFNY